MLIDHFGRKIDYLRISVTDRCNLRCIYCMPECGIIHRPPEELLTFEEIAEIVKAGVKLGISKIRITGGEPLVRKDIASLIKSLSAIAGIEDLSMTTNGLLLKEYALSLKEAGLKRLNISLDSLNKDRYRFISRGGSLEAVKEGIKIAMKVFPSPLKINVLLLAGINEDGIADFLRLTIENNIHVRFLEFMPVNDFLEQKNFIYAQAVLDVARGFQKIEETIIYGNGPAKNFRFKGALGTFGLIAPLSEKFCASCNRLRLTSDGFIKACLHSEAKVGLRDPLRKGAAQQELIKLIETAVALKPKEHGLDKGSLKPSEYLMCQIGG